MSRRCVWIGLDAFRPPPRNDRSIESNGMCDAVLPPSTTKLVTSKGKPHDYMDMKAMLVASRDQVA